ncbi:hypothetical protein MMC06_001159 [Schaereria dolodes]|nr:hypothetical protein [Schaereria dolodes]
MSDQDPIVSHGRGGGRLPVSLFSSSYLEQRLMSLVLQVLPISVMTMPCEYRFPAQSKFSHPIHPDDPSYACSYTDGEIVREGPTGDQGDGAFSTGRGGQGNIGSPKVRATSLSSPGDSEVIPETALRRPSQDNYHVGVRPSLSCLFFSSHNHKFKLYNSTLIYRILPCPSSLKYKLIFPSGTEPQRGGQGNIHSEEPNQSHVGLADKLKNKIFKKSQEKETSG